MTEIANEKGLDSQNYQCRGCGRNIGESSLRNEGFWARQKSVRFLRYSLGLSRLEGVSLDLTEKTGQDDVMTYTEDMHTL